MKTCLSFLCLMMLAFSSHASTNGTGTVGIRLAFEPATLDWNLGDVPIHVINNVVEGLYTVGGGGQVAPNEAIGFPRQKSATQWVIRLRPDLKWSDGKPVRAQDYVYSWTRLLHPKTASTYAYLLFHLAGAQDFNRGKVQVWQGARAINDQEIELTLEPAQKGITSPHLSVFTHWATFPMREDAGIKVFNGPYKITLNQPDVKIELEPNTAHRRPGTLKKIEALVVQDDATALRLYEAGRLHFMSDLAFLDRSLTKARSDFYSRPSPILVYVGIDAREPLLKSPELRKQLSHAIDREAIPKIMGAAHVPAYGFTSPDLNPAPFSNRRIDPALAHQFDGKQLVFGYYEKGMNRTLAEFLQAQLKKKLGLNISLVSTEVKSYWKKLSENPYPFFLNSFAPPVWDSYYYFGLLRSNNPMNMGRWSDHEYDAAFDANAKKQRWVKLASLLESKTPVIPLYFRSYDYLMSPKLKGALINPMTSLYLDHATLER